MFNTLFSHHQPKTVAYSFVVLLALPGLVSSAPLSATEMNTAAQIQWSLAQMGCDPGPVDGLLHAARGVSRSERCLRKFNIQTATTPGRMLNELNYIKLKQSAKSLPLDEMRSASQGLGTRTRSRVGISPSPYERTRAARESLINLAQRDAQPFLLLGLSSDRDDIRGWCQETIQSDRGYQSIPVGIWQIINAEGRISDGIAWFFHALPRTSRLNNIQAIIKTYLDERVRRNGRAINGQTLLADAVFEVWNQGRKSNRTKMNELTRLVALVLDAMESSDDAAIVLNEEEVDAIFQKFGRSIVAPLAKVYGDIGAGGEQGQQAETIRQYILTNGGDPIYLLQTISQQMIPENQGVLARLVRDIAEEMI